jgi:hypothetical protein
LPQAPGADGTGACRQIEEARCQRAPGCSISLEPPFHTSGGDVDACIRFYDVACSHGLAVGEPGAAAVNACVAAIRSGPCTVVQTPQSDLACAWLASPTTTAAATPDAASAEDAAAGADVGVDASTATSPDATTD